MLQTRITELRTLATDKALTRAQAQEAIRELCDEVVKLQRRREKPRFTLHDVMTEAERMCWAPGLAEECFDVYDAVGWVRGKNRIPIVRLPSAMRTWMRNRQKWNCAPVNGNQPSIGKRYGVG